MNGLKIPRSAVYSNRESRREKHLTRGSYPRRTELLGCALLAACLAAGCASLPAEKIAPPRKAIRVDDAASFAGREWFWGIYIMGKRVGYSYLKIERAPSMKDVLKITSKLKMDEIVKREETQIDYTMPDLTLLRTEHVQVRDGEARRVIAVVRPGEMELQTTMAERSTWKTRELPHAVYPSSVIDLLPIVWGLWLDNSYRYPVFMPSTSSIGTVKQHVTGYERVEEFGRPAFRITTKFEGNKTQSWIDIRGNKLLEKGDIGFLSMSLVLENP